MNKIAVAFALALTFSQAHALGPTRTAADYGNSIATGMATPDKRIVVTPQTTKVDVTDGQVVEFVIGDRTYLWHFQTFNGEHNFELAKIIPQGRGVTVYVERNPLYRGY